MANGRVRAVVLMLPLLFLTGALMAQVTDQSLSLEAHAKYDAGDLDQAETLFAKLLQDFASSSLCPDAQYHLGWIAYKKNTGQAESRWQAVVAKYPNSP